MNTDKNNELVAFKPTKQMVSITANDSSINIIEILSFQLRSTNVEKFV